MRLFGFRGGVHPEALKQHTTELAIKQLPLPKRLYIPLQQHIGAPAKPGVTVGERVAKGQFLARSQGMISAAIHAPSSGRVIAIDPFAAPHPSGLPVLTITLETDGEDRWWSDSKQVPENPFDLDPGLIAERVGKAGIVGLGGATFPSAVKLKPDPKNPIHTLIINGSECEPYLTCDDRLMQERADQIIDGVRLVQHTTQAAQAYVAIEDNKPLALKAMQAAAAVNDDVKVIKVPSRYPMGWEKQLIKLITGQELPHGKLPANIGVCVHNVGTVHAIHHLLRQGHPLVSRIVTVAGGAVRAPQNLEVPIGTLVSELVDYCGGLSEQPARLLMGGPMMGQIMPHTQVPVVKGSSGILALTHHEIDDGPERPCIRCGRCVDSCPVGLMPLEMANRLRSDDVKGAEGYGVQDCIGCGCCSYVCPSKIPLVQYFNFAKGEIRAQKEAETKAAQTKALAQSRIARLAREEAAKQARKAAKKAAQDKSKASPSLQDEATKSEPSIPPKPSPTKSSPRTPEPTARPVATQIIATDRLNAIKPTTVPNPEGVTP